MDLNPVILSIPIYFLLIGIELMVQLFSKESLYRLNDAVTNISCGITQQISGAFLKVGLVAVYAVCYQYLSIFKIEPSLWSYCVLFVLVDFCYYWAHRMSHEISLFWGGHVVHHQSEDYNFSVALRQGSFQVLWTTAFYLPLAIIGFDTLSYIFISALVTVYQFWIHTEKIGKLGPLEWVLNTPSHHRVHHGRNPKYIDKNHAGVFIVWDRMFGTFQEEEERPTYGVTVPVQSWNPLWVNVQHYAGMWQQLKQCRSWADRWRTLINKPGWRPDYLGGYQAPPEIDEASCQKYNPDISRGLQYYILAHYLITLGGAAAFLFNEAALGLGLKALLGLLVLLAVVSLGLLMEKPGWAYYLEGGRLLLTVVVLIQLLNLPWLIWAGAIYVLLSCLWLWRLRGQSVPAERIAAHS
jgi:alkylglycerol monooxygenase